ncbi:MAG: hypothetical protein MSG64_03160 [Pyrinomonadaceae bacterium MAG19_C2-C3]|nr:hypothetical protein [Pyrinomonadaceae bacterium MAG19_C2-C3]
MKHHSSNFYCARYLSCLLAVALFAACLPVSSFAQVPVRPYTVKPSKLAIEYANRELARMSVDEKIGQLISVGINASFLNRESPAYKELERQVTQNHIGGIILFRSPVYEAAILMNRMQAKAARPLLVSADLEAGTGMRFEDTINFPWNMALGASGDANLARKQGAITAREARALGVYQVFAPTVDVNNNADNPVINVRSYGEDPMLVGRLASAFIEGVQAGGVIATAKHFPGHGDTAVDSHRGLPIINVSRERLNNVELVPFKQAINAGVGSVMPSHISLPQLDATEVKPLPREKIVRPVYADAKGEVFSANATLPATLSPKILRGILRDDLNFDGLIVTDAMDMSGLTIYFDQQEAAVRAVEAGADVLLKPANADDCIKGLRLAVGSGRLKESRIEASARRVLAAKYDLGLVANRMTDIDAIDRIVSAPEVAQLVSEIAERGMTLVRDERTLVPLKKAPPTAENQPVFYLVITNGDDRNYVANGFLSAMNRAGFRGDVAVLDARSSEQEIADAVAKAAGAGRIVAALYGRVRTGEARSVGLPDAGAKALNLVLENHAAKTIGISFGNPYLLMSFPRLQTYMVAYGDMPSLQAAAARAVTGASPITGRLPITLPNLYARGTGIMREKVDGSAKAATINATTSTPRDGVGEGKKP